MSNRVLVCYNDGVITEYDVMTKEHFDAIIAWGGETYWHGKRGKHSEGSYLFLPENFEITTSDQGDIDKAIELGFVNKYSVGHLKESIVEPLPGSHDDNDQFICDNPKDQALMELLTKGDNDE